MSELVENESIDDRARRAVKHLRLDASVRPLPELRHRPRRRWLYPIVAAVGVVAVVVGLVVIGTNRNKQSVGGDEDRFRWIVTELPAGWKAQNALNPNGPNDRTPPAPLDNVYATDSAPAGPVLTVTGSAGSPGEAPFDINYQELSIDGRRAALADSSDGRRIMFIESDGYWIQLTSRHIDDAVLTRLAQSAVRSADGTALIPPAQLSDGLKPVAAPGTFYDPNLAARVEGAVSTYVAGTDGTRELALSVGRLSASTRAGVALRSETRAVSVGSTRGYGGSFDVGPDPITVFRTLYWEHHGVAFYLEGRGLSDAEMLTAATSVRTATDDEWAALVNAPLPNVITEGTSLGGTTPADTIAASSDAVRDVPIEVAVTVHSPNQQTWSGTLPTGEPWSLELSRVYDTISFLGEVDGQSAGISGLPFDSREGATTIQGFDGGYVVTADKRGSAMRIVRSNGDRYTIPLHDLPGTNDLRVAVLGLPGTSPERRIELIDANGIVIEAYVDGVRLDAEGNVIEASP
jgi:hypothetical protein